MERTDGVRFWEGKKVKLCWIAGCWNFEEKKDVKYLWLENEDIMEDQDRFGKET